MRQRHGNRRVDGIIFVAESAMLPQKKMIEDSRRSELVEYKPPTLASPLAVPGPAQQAGTSADGLAKGLWRRRWAILTFTLISLAIAFVYLDRAPKIYTG